MEIRQGANITAKSLSVAALRYGADRRPKEQFAGFPIFNFQFFIPTPHLRSVG